MTARPRHTLLAAALISVAAIGITPLPSHAAPAASCVVVKKTWWETAIATRQRWAERRDRIKKPVSDAEFRQLVMAPLKQAVGDEALLEMQNIMDAACGPGSLRKWFDQAHGMKVSPEYLKQLDSRLPRGARSAMNARAKKLGVTTEKRAPRIIDIDGGLDGIYDYDVDTDVDIEQAISVAAHDDRWLRLFVLFEASGRAWQCGQALGNARLKRELESLLGKVADDGSDIALKQSWAEALEVCRRTSLEIAALKDTPGRSLVGEFQKELVRAVANGFLETDSTQWSAWAERAGAYGAAVKQLAGFQVEMTQMSRDIGIFAARAGVDYGKTLESLTVAVKTGLQRARDWTARLERADAGVLSEIVDQAPGMLESVRGLRLAAVARFSDGLIDRLVAIHRHDVNCGHIYEYCVSGQVDGGGLYALEADESGWNRRCIVDAGAGQIQRCDVSYDGTEILFNWRRREDGPFYQVYRVRVDGSGLKQLTQGKHHNYDACWLPDGDIVFLSTRSDRKALCHWTPAGTLHRMDRDGKRPRILSTGNLHDFTPTVMNDGTIVYSRWEYVDKAAIPIQSLWTINPDGTMLRVFYGNRILDPATFMEARAVPGTASAVLCTFTGHNGPVRGLPGIVRSDHGDDNPDSMRCLTGGKRFNIGRSSNGPRGPYETPYPVDGRHYLVSRDGSVLLGMLDDGAELTLVPREADKMGFYSAKPLGPRRRPLVRASALPASGQSAGIEWGSVYLLDVYRGLGAAVQRGEVRRIAVVEERIKSDRNHDTHRGKFAFQLTAISAGATYAPKKLWGYARVYDDGSAHFKVPANRPIYFIALDAMGRDVQRMRSFTHLQPGERQGCIGCHEPRNTAPGMSRMPKAVKLPAQELETPEWGVDGFAFVERVQPVLNKHCIKCHGAREPAAGKPLTDTKQGLFTRAYLSLLGPVPDRTTLLDRKPLTAWVPTNNGQEWTIRMIRPKTWGSSNSRLADLVLNDHPDKSGKKRISLSDSEKDVIITWMNLNCPFYKSYQREPQSLAECDGSGFGICAAPAAVERYLLVGDYSGEKVALYSREKGIVWRHKVAGCYDVAMRSNGNIIFSSYAGVQEMAPDIDNGSGGRILWSYKCGSAFRSGSPAKSEVHGCDVLPNGNVIVAEAGTKRLVELDAAGKPVAEIPLEVAERGVHVQLRGVRAVSVNSFVVALLADGLFNEVDRTGKIIHSIRSWPDGGRKQHNAYLATPLANGNWLTANAGQANVVEYCRQGRELWRIEADDIKGTRMGWVTVAVRTGDGNTIVGDWQGKPWTLFEVTRDKQVVWSVGKEVFGGVTAVTVLGSDYRPAAGVATAP